MALYQDSTQARFWSLTAHDLLSLREETHQHALSSRPPDPPPLSLQQEALIRRHHERRILRFNRANNLPDKLAATAIMYFKRFFLHRSVMDYNPSVIALSAVYASSKVEEIVFDARDLIARFDASVNGVASDTSLQTAPMSLDHCAVRVSADAILNTELWFLQQINFHLICYHPFKSLGIVREKLLESKICAEQQQLTHALSQLIPRAENIIRTRALLTDLPLAHPPAIIAIAATLVAAEAKETITEQQILQVLVGDNNKLVSRIQTAANILRALSDHAPEHEPKQVAAIEKQRKAVQKNINDPMSQEYKDMEQEQLRLEDEEELQRARAFQEKMKRRAEDLFGFASMDVPNKRRKVET
ncbi:unnamed protein product [Agarophyton chilense]|eukprot:gb/GEZJ01002344.1/.p1 GENE.gb/GEZJ01002344.1/~~gb/GEZJ01002344.1/.p1  ORF type:complete len:359 (-),score=74.23 gb/GEZJ01002344.1/:526-1602(-)